jgi:hypothetical protein
MAADFTIKEKYANTSMIDGFQPTGLFDEYWEYNMKLFCL